MIERVVLALAGGNHFVAHGGDELDQLHAGGRLIAGADGVDDAHLIGHLLEIGADGHVRLDIHHHQMLAMLDHLEADLGTGDRLAGGVDDDVDEAVVHQQVGIGHNGGLAGFDQGADRRIGLDLDGAVGLALGDAHRIMRLMRTARDDGRDLDALHLRHLRDDVGAHLAATDDPDPDGAAFRSPLCKVTGKARQGDIGHGGILRSVCAEIDERQRLFNRGATK